VPLHDDRALFEFLVLEGAQAGLSWSTILRKRDAYRRAFDRFDPQKVARYNKRKISTLLADAGIVRNRAKIEIGDQERQGVSRSPAKSSEASTRNQWRFVEAARFRIVGRAVGRFPAHTVQSDASEQRISRAAASSFDQAPTIIYAHIIASGW